MNHRTPVTLLIALALAHGFAASPAASAPAPAPPAAQVSAPAPASAPHSGARSAAPQTWAVVPANASGPDGRGSIEHVIEPGDTYADHVAVRNLGAAELTVELSVHGASQTAESDFGLAASGGSGSQLAAWAALDGGRMSVEPGAAVVVPIRFVVPADAEPGDRAGGIVARAVGAEGDDVQYQVGTRVHLRVAGPVEPGLRLDDARASVSWTLLPFARLDGQGSVTVVNTGNVRLTPAVRAEARALFGLWEAPLGVVEPGELLPEGAKNVASALTGVPQLGPVWVTFSVREAASLGQDVSPLLDDASITVVVWAVPWTLIAFVLVLGVAAAVALRNLGQRRAGLREARALKEPPSA